DLTPRNVLQDALVRGGLAADVVIFRESVHRHGYAHARNLHPLRWNGNHGAGYDQRENSRLTKRGKNSAQLAMPNQRLTTDQRDVHRFVLAHEIENAVY